MIALEMSAMSAFLKAREIMRDRELDSFSSASEIALNSSTESSRHDYIAASKIDELINEDIDTSVWEKALRKILKTAILSGDYPWKGSFKYGRKYVLESLSINERQVFRSAGLVSNEFNEEIVSWWDQMQIALGVAQPDFEFRKWEQRTFDREIALLTKLDCPNVPRWVAIDDNMVGFDILSFRENDEKWEEVFIEVKSSSTGLKRFFLSDREAEKLESSPDRYILYFWDTTTTTDYVFTGAELIHHLPKNQGRGAWKSVLLNL